MTRVWVNRTFATTHQLIGLWRRDPLLSPLHVLASHKDETSPVLVAADEVLPELPGEGDAYAEAALQRCLDLRINVFWPTWQREAVAHRAAEFRAHGIRVPVSSAHAESLCEDKGASYRAAALAGVPVPPYRVVTDADAFAAAVEALGHHSDTNHSDMDHSDTTRSDMNQSDMNHSDMNRDDDTRALTFKPVLGAGGQGFRVLRTRPLRVEDLYLAVTPTVSLDEVMALLRQVPTFPALMVMPWLPGPEVSVDLLADDGRLVAAVCRRKGPGRGITLEDDPELLGYAATVVEAFGLDHLANVQLRRDGEGRWQLLEVNPRASGGLFQTCRSGLDLASAGLRHVLGLPLELATPSLPMTLLPLPEVVQRQGSAEAAT